jgi:hypothetical protein
MARISFEQKGTKGTKEEFFFVAFVCFCGDFFAMRGTDGEFLIREIREIRGSISLVAARSRCVLCG